MLCWPSALHLGHWPNSKFNLQGPSASFGVHSLYYLYPHMHIPSQYTLVGYKHHPTIFLEGYEQNSTFVYGVWKFAGYENKPIIALWGINIMQVLSGVE